MGKVDDPSGPHFQEWISTRGVISAADTNLDSIRKTGITLITALLTANAFLLPGNVSGVTALPESLKFGVLLATLILLGAVAVIDRNYQVLQQAAATRALILEREMNIELTEVISQRYAQNNVGLIFHLIYVVLGAAVLSLGYFVLGITPLFGVLAVIWVAWSALVLLISVNIHTNKGADWSLDKTYLNSGEVFHIMVTNLYAMPAPSSLLRGYGPFARRYIRTHTFHIEPGRTLWQVVVHRTGEEPELLERGTVGAPVSLGPEETYVWAVKTPSTSDSMILHVHPTSPGQSANGRTEWSAWPSPLRRKVKVDPTPVPSTNHSTAE
jgi:hypothetical protein